MSDADASRLSAGEVKRQLQTMDDEDFEYFVADLWERDGWTTEVSQKSRDKSLDVLAERDSPYHQRHAIQAKRYQEDSRVSGPKISEYASLRDQFDADAAVVVTTSGFTKDARERGDTLNVKLVDGDDLVGMVEQYDAYDLVREYGDLDTEEERADYESEGATTATTAVDESRSVTADSYDWSAILTYAGSVWAAILLLYTGLDSTGGSLVATALLIPGLIAMVITEFALYKRLQQYQRTGVWYPETVWWLLGAMVIPFIAVPYYKYVEWKLPPLEGKSAVHPV